MTVLLGHIRKRQSGKTFIALLIPLILAGALQLNNHLYYDLDLGYDMPMHFNNTMAIIDTGQMPPPPLLPNTYEAHQAPAFYYLSAWILQITNYDFDWYTFIVIMPWVLYLVGMIWVILIANFVLRTIRPIPLFLRSLIICVVVLFPNNTIMSVMYNNDLSVTIFGALSVWTLWLMCRTNQLTSKSLWLRAALLAGLATLFKLSGLIIIGVYGALAAYIILQTLWQRHFEKARQVIIAASLGLPLMLIPWMYNSNHTSQYIESPLGVIGDAPYVWDVVDPSFFLTFDLDIFDVPFAFETGKSSFWTLQFLTLHNDYYNHWNSSAYKDYPPYRLVEVPHRDPMPYTRLQDAVVLQYLAIPITLVMVFGVGVSLYRLIFRNRFALRDGSVVVLIYVGMSQGAQLVRFIAHPDIKGVIIHARHLGFIYGFMFIIGAWWLLKLTKHRRYGEILSLSLATFMLAYSLVAIRLMWLPPI